MEILCTVYKIVCKFYKEETSVTVFGMFVNATDEVLTPEVVKIPGMECRA
jgi:hypothetical protein